MIETAKSMRLNTRQVRATLDGRKTETRRPIKGYFDVCMTKDGVVVDIQRKDENDNWIGSIKPPYQPGNVVYVRETWCKHTDMNNNAFEGNLIQGFYYKADAVGSWQDDKEVVKWRPSIHMPKEAARVFLRVTEVTAERLQEIEPDDILDEIGDLEWCNRYCSHLTAEEGYCKVNTAHCALLEQWEKLWDSIYKSRGYGWDLNPWVTVTKFERLEV